MLGTCIGSFLNVVIYRFNTGMTLGGRSFCMTCNRKLAWYELVPVFSFLSLGGKCRTCKTSISRQYPLVEIATGLIFSMLVSRFSEFLPHTGVFLSHLLYHMFMWSLLIVIAVYDFRHKIIPNRLMYIFILVALCALFVSAQGTIVPSPSSLLAGIAIPLPFAAIWYLSRGKWMGFGDVKLMSGLGFYLGLSQGIAAVMLSFWLGAVVGILLIFFRKSKYGMKSEIPFGPFLIVGALIAFMWNIGLFELAKVFIFK